MKPTIGDLEVYNLTLTVGSLFSGIGGLDLGLERSGMNISWQCEKDPFCKKVLKKHWPEVDQYDDIRALDGKELPGVDVIAGGFPCQDISIAGPGHGIKEGTRSGLWWNMFQIICDIRPKYVILENVPMLTHRGMGEVLGALASIGYNAEWNIVSASGIGARHQRKRIFIVAYPISLGSQRKNVSAFWGPSGYFHLVPGGVCSDVSDSNSNYILRWGYGKGENEFQREAQIQGCKQWAIESGVDRVAHGVPNWMDRIRTLGNAVVPNVAEMVGKMVIMHSMEE